VSLLLLFLLFDCARERTIFYGREITNFLGSATNKNTQSNNDLIAAQPNVYLIASLFGSPLTRRVLS
jgi:hypothetical protein